MGRPRIGMISPPGWSNFCREEMQMVAGRDIDVVDVVMPLGDDFSFAQGQILAAATAIEVAATQLAKQNVDAILQIGGPFAFLHDAHRAAELEAHITRQAGVPFCMMALCMLRTLERRAVKSVMVCSAYYPKEWQQPLVRFVAASGVYVVGCLSFQEIELSQTQDVASMADEFENFDPDQVINAVAKCAQDTSAEAIYLSGIPCPLLAHKARLENAAQVPLISYLDSYARLFESVGIRQA